MVGSLEFIKSVTVSTVTSVSITDIFSDKYDVYFISLFDGQGSGSTNIAMTLLDSVGTEITASEYDYALLNMPVYASFAESKATNTTSFPTMSFVTDSNGQGTGIYIFNPYDSSSYTFVIGQSSTWNTGNGLIGRKQIGVHKVAEQTTGVVFKRLTSPYTIGFTAKVYGVK